MSARTHELRAAVIAWPSGQIATLTLEGWRVEPADPTLAELLNAHHGLAAAQAARRTDLPPDLLAFAAHRAALALGAEIERIDPSDTRGAQPGLCGFGN